MTPLDALREKIKYLTDNLEYLNHIQRNRMYIAILQAILVVLEEDK